MKKSLIVLFVIALSCPQIALADLVITEIMSSSSISGLNGDWWELTNTSLVSVDLTGYSWDDDHERVGRNIFNAIAIGPGESIIILDEVPDGSVEEWKFFWSLGPEGDVYGNNYPSFYFSGLGNGDGVFLYDPSGALVTSAMYTSHTNGFSNQWDTEGTFLGLSIIGQYGAYHSQLGSPDIASPGYAVHIQNTCTLAGMVYWTDKDASKIQRANCNCGGVEDLLTAADGLIDPRGILLDLASRKMYWADNGTNKIQRADLDGSNIEDLVSGLQYPADIDLDLSGGKIYWADQDAGKIQRKNLDGTGLVDDVITSIQPYYLALDMVNDKIYWSDFDSPVIHRANLDGTAIEDFITGLDRVRDIALDVADGKIYWGDRDTSKIQRANLDGTGIEDLFAPADGLDRPHGLALDTVTGKIFWTDTATQMVRSANMDGSGTVENLATGLSSPWGIAIISTKQIIYVDADAPGPIHNGFNWNNAFLYLQDALDAAASGDEIRVAQGTYIPDQNSTNPSGSGDRVATFLLVNGVAIKGGYAGFGELEPDKRDIEINKTILSGDLAGNDIEVVDITGLLSEQTRFENSYHVVTGRYVSHTALLEGFIITAGNANEDWVNRYGGGMYNCSNPNVKNCTFIGNLAYGGGGLCNAGDMTLANCTLSDNTACFGGGMKNLYLANPIVTNCTFNSNYVTKNGGGMHNSGNNAGIINCVFNANIAVFYGGGMHNDQDASPIVTNCTFSNNSAEICGGFYNDYPSILMATNSIFWNNNDSGGVDESAQIYNNNSYLAPEVNYCCVQGWTGGLGGIGNHGNDPLFIDADGIDNIAGTEDDDLRLPDGSSCFNAGDNTALLPDVADLDSDGDTAELTPLDMSGNLRIINGTVDMGAYEFEKYSADFNGDLPVDLYDFCILAQQWLKTGDSYQTDLIEDNKIDELDLAAFAEQWLVH